MHTPVRTTSNPLSDESFWSDVQRELDTVEQIHHDRPSSSNFSAVESSTLPKGKQPVEAHQGHEEKTSHTIRKLARSNNDSPPILAPKADWDSAEPPPTLIDIGASPPDRSNQLPSSLPIFILQTEVEGFIIADPSYGYRKTIWKSGTLMAPLSDLRNESIITVLKRFSRSPTDVFMRDISHSSSYAVVRICDTMRISSRQARLLRALDVDERNQLHKDFERLHFIEHLKVGKSVLVETYPEDGKKMVLRPANIRAISDFGRNGMRFQVEVGTYGMNNSQWSSSGPIISVNASKLHHTPPSTVYEPRSTLQRSEVRNIPIRRIETTFDADNSTQTRQLNGFKSSERISPTANRNAAIDEFRECMPKPVRPERERDRERTKNLNFHPPTQPSRSQSAYAMWVHDRTYSVDDPLLTKGILVGDRFKWNDGNSVHRGTIRFIGYLKGHSNIYAGVEFDDAVGKGCGVYQGETIFNTPENRAGFLVLGSLDVEKTRVPRADTLLDFNTKKDSVEILPSRPPVPPRPIMEPQDFLIDAFSVGSCVEVCHVGACRTGVIRWMGDELTQDGDHLEKCAVVEIDGDVPDYWPRSPTHGPVCSDRNVLVPVSNLRRDRRIEQSANHVAGKRDNEFGSIDSGIESTACLPCQDSEYLVGRIKGIQGHQNSCYLDSTLYAMFVQTTKFDKLLERPYTRRDIEEYPEVVRVLSTEIVYPLRRFHYVRADHMMRFRELLDQILPNMPGLTNEEKDPEEILQAIFSKILRVHPFLELINVKDGSKDKMYIQPLIVEDWQGSVATTQHLLERSMRASGVKFSYAPETLILQLPRYGQQKILERIVPLEVLDITGLVHREPISCRRCGKTADGMCPECFLCKKVYISEVSFCLACFPHAHSNLGERDHVIQKTQSNKNSRKCSSDAIQMKLSAVLCIETSHYVAYVRTTNGTWLFYDSMADREGLSNGYNIPEVKVVPGLSWWLSHNGYQRLVDDNDSTGLKTLYGKKNIDGLVSRVLSDSYICFYEFEERTTPTSSPSTVLDSLKKSLKSL